jgi:hypothetical protein
MDKTQLIELVIDVTPLWDKRDKIYHNRDLKPKLWDGIYLSGLVTAVAVFGNPDTIPFCLTTDLILNVFFSWLFVHLPSTFFLDVLFFFFPLVSTP